MLKECVKAGYPRKAFFYHTIICLLLLGCQNGESVEKEIERLGRNTIPSEAKMIRNIEVDRKQHSVHAVWEFQLERNWKEYLRWVEGNLEQYKTAGTGSSQATFRRFLPADVYHLEIQNVSTSLLHIRVRFSAFPR